MFGPSEYDRGSVPWLFKSFSQTALLNILQQIDGEKDLLISPELIQPLDMVVSFSKLKDCGIKKIYKLQDGPCEGVTDSRVFLVNNEPSTARTICDKVNSEQIKKPQMRFYILSVPKLNKISDMLFEKNGIYGSIQCINFPLSFVPLDSDLLSLEQDNFHDCFFLRKNNSVVFNVSKALDQISYIFGKPHRVTGIGKMSQMALELNTTLHADCQNSSQSYDHLILFDRNIDYYSIFLSPLNYIALLDETFPMKCSKVDLPEEIFQKLNIRKYTAQSVDPIFRHIRDSHLSVASSNLKKIAMELRGNSPSSKDMTISEMKEFVQKELKNRKALQLSLRLHITLCEEIMEKKKEINFASQLVLERDIVEGDEYRECINHLENMITRQDCPIISLRLMCLLSICYDGLSNRDYNCLVKLYLQSYGYENMIIISSLNKLRLLTKQANPMQFLLSNSPPNPVSNVISQSKAAAISALPKKSHFRNQVKKFNLRPDDSSGQRYGSEENVSTNKHGGSVFGNIFIPFIYRIVEHLMTEPSSSTDYLSELSKSLFQRINAGLGPSNSAIVVFFVGGVSYAEVSALRHLGKLKKRDIIILTTNVINGSKFLTRLSQFN